MTGPVPTTGDLNRIVNGQPEVIQPDPDPAAEALKDRISTWLSALSMLAIVGGLGAGLWMYGLGENHGGGWGPFGLVPAGLALAFMLAVADGARRPSAVTVARPEKPSPPGPTDPGRLHTKGPGARP